MQIPVLSRLFRGSDARAEDEVIPLADFNLHPLTTINVTPGAGEPVESSVKFEPAGRPVPEELKPVVERLAGGIVEAWNGAVRDMQAILAADHARMETAASEMGRVTDQLRSVTEELTEIRRRLLALEGSYEGLQRAQQGFQARFEVHTGVLRQLHGLAVQRAAQMGDLVSSVRTLEETLAKSSAGPSLPENL